MYTSLRKFHCTRKTLNAMLVILKSMAKERREVPVVIEGSVPSCRLWMIPTNKTFKYLANADIQTYIEMTILPLSKDDVHGFKFRRDIEEFVDALTKILGQTNVTSVAISLILDDNDVDLTMSPQILSSELE